MVIDAARGVEENTRRHGYFLSMLGISQVAVLVNKMDLAGYREDVYRTIVREFTEFLEKIHISPAAFIPVSGMEGDNIALRSDRMSWYDGPTVLEQMDAFAPYAEKLVAFSYHYIDTMQAASLEMDSAAVARFYADYRDYYLRNFASVAERRTVVSRLPGGALAGDLFRIPGGEARWELRDAAGRVMGSGRGSVVRMPEATGFYALHLERPSGAHDMALWRVPGVE